MGDCKSLESDVSCEVQIDTSEVGVHQEHGDGWNGSSEVIELVLTM